MSKDEVKIWEVERRRLGGGWIRKMEDRMCNKGGDQGKEVVMKKEKDVVGRGDFCEGWCVRECKVHEEVPAHFSPHPHISQ